MRLVGGGRGWKGWVFSHSWILSTFRGSSDGKESACSAGDLGSIPGLGGSLKEGMATLSSILAWRIPMDRGAWQAIVHGAAKSQTRLNTAELDPQYSGQEAPIYLLPEFWYSVLPLLAL